MFVISSVMNQFTSYIIVQKLSRSTNFRKKFVLQKEVDKKIEYLYDWS